MDLAREREVVLQDAFVSQLAEVQNVRIYVLALVTAVFLPLTFVAGLFGMNIGGLSGVATSNGFAVVAIIMLIACFAIVAYFRKKKWF